MFGLAKLISFGFGVSLLIITVWLGFWRKPDQVAYWLLVREPTTQINQFEYFLASPDGQIKKALIPSVPDNFNWYLGWSPDGQYIFCRVNLVASQTAQSGIFRLDIYSGEIELLVEASLGLDEIVFTPSPNRKWLALSIPRHDDQNVYILGANGSPAYTLPKLSISLIYWSQDSQAIYYGDYSEGRFQQFRISIDNYQAEVVVWAETYYRYSPDGTAYAFFEDDKRDVWYIRNLETEAITPLTPPDETGFFVLGWLSHDWILIEQNGLETGATGLYRVRPDGSDWQLLYEIEESTQPRFLPFWDAKAEWIYFDNFTDSGEHTIERFHINTLDHESIIADFKPIETTFHPLNSYLGEPTHVLWVRELDTLIWWQPINNIPSHFELRQVQADGTDEQVLFKVDEYYEFFDIQVSPDNQWLYINLASSTRNGWETQIWRANLHERQQEQIFAENTELVAISPPIEMDYSAERLKLGGIGLIILTGLGVVLFRKR